MCSPPSVSLQQPDIGERAKISVCNGVMGPPLDGRESYPYQTLMYSLPVSFPEMVIAR